PATSCGKGRSRVWSGSFTSSNWLKSWDSSAKFNFGDNHVDVVDDPVAGKVLRVTYPAGAVANDSGAQFRAQVKGLPADSICLSYWLKFADGFKWNKGGKLPGLCGGDCPSGGAPTNNGWSMRYMWRIYGAGEEYAYVIPPPADGYGTELGLGKWQF